LPTEKSSWAQRTVSAFLDCSPSAGAPESRAGGSGQPRHMRYAIEVTRPGGACLSVTAFSRFAASFALAVLLPAVAAAQAPAPAERSPVLVELFTSEGCPHCPEADGFLEKLYSGQPIQGAEIIALEEHVDYWDRPAWVDHFSSPLFTARQKAYAEAMDIESLYTPQMVVDGLVEFVGNNEGRARATITALGHAPKATAQLIAMPAGKTPASGKIIASADLPAGHPDGEVFLVLAEDKLTSSVQGGSNAGETWAHSSVARRFQQVGEIPAGEQHFSLSFDPAPPEAGWKGQNLRLILIVQAKDDRQVLAIQSARLADLMPAAGGGASDASGAVPKTAPASSKPTGPGNGPANDPR